MNQLIPALRSTELLDVFVTGHQKVLAMFGPVADFKREFERLLIDSGFGGKFKATVDTRIKGSPHTQGLLLGALNYNRRSIELKWQSGGNDTRFSIQVSVPRDMEPAEFHTRLDQTLKNRDATDNVIPIKRNEIVREPVPEPASTAVEDADVDIGREPLTDVHIDLFVREICPSATQAGIITRQRCIEVLSELGRSDCDEDLLLLIEERHLAPGASQAFLRISQEWLTRLRPETAAVKTVAPIPEPKPEPKPMPKPVQKAEPAVTPKAEPRAAALPSHSNLVQEVARLSQMVEKAHQLRSGLQDTQREVADLEALIARSHARLAVLKPQLAEAERFLANPELDTAEKMLTALRQVLVK